MTTLPDTDNGAVAAYAALGHQDRGSSAGSFSTGEPFAATLDLEQLG